MEILRHLILRGRLPSHPREPQAAGEPEDDLTPTPSVVNITSHPWDPGSPGRAPTVGEGENTQLPGPEGGQPEPEDVALCSLEHLPPRTRNSGIWEPPELDRSPEEEASGTEAAGSYKVVRKGKINWGPLGRQTPSFARVEASLPKAASFPTLFWKPLVCRAHPGS